MEWRPIAEYDEGRHEPVDLWMLSVIDADRRLYHRVVDVYFKKDAVGYDHARIPTVRDGWLRFTKNRVTPPLC